MAASTEIRTLNHRTFPEHAVTVATQQQRDFHQIGLRVNLKRNANKVSAVRRTALSSRYALGTKVSVRVSRDTLCAPTVDYTGGSRLSDLMVSH